MAIGFVVAYHYSGRNLAITITLHMINNLISYFLLLFRLFGNRFTPIEVRYSESRNVNLNLLILLFVIIDINDARTD